MEHTFLVQEPTCTCQLETVFAHTRVDKRTLWSTHPVRFCVLFEANLSLFLTEVADRTRTLSLSRTWKNASLSTPASPVDL